MKQRNVSHLQLTQAIFIPGYKDLNSRTIQPSDRWDMISNDTGVLCRAGKVEFLIPWHMVQVAIFVKDEVDAQKAA